MCAGPELSESQFGLWGPAVACFLRAVPALTEPACPCALLRAWSPEVALFCAGLEPGEKSLFECWFAAVVWFLSAAETLNEALWTVASFPHVAPAPSTALTGSGAP